jgi:hypothetical protein
VLHPAFGMAQKVKISVLVKGKLLKSKLKMIRL